MYYSVTCCTFTRCNVFVLHFSPVAVLACCNFFLLHFVHVALFPEVYSGTPQTSKMESFRIIINKAVKHRCKALHLRCSRSFGCTSTISKYALFPCYTLSMLHFFHVALLLLCTFFVLQFFMLHLCMLHFSMLHSFHVALVYCWKKLKMKERQQTTPKSDLTLKTVNLFRFYFDSL